MTEPIATDAMNSNATNSDALTSGVAEQRLTCPTLPLAVYRELAAHLRQVTGVEAELLPQPSTTFDYSQSQVGGIVVRFTDLAPAASRLRAAQILAYYGDRYGGWLAGPS